MAETVKKSRIVSEDNLEESLMEEFNMRLKNCSSQDPLENIAEPPRQEENLYENIETIKTSSAIITKSFIQTERTEEILNSSNISNGHSESTRTENIYENVQTITKSSPDYMDMEGNAEKKDKANAEAIYEDLRTEEQIETEDAKCERTKPSFTLLTAASIDAPDKTDLKSAKDRMLLSSDDTSTLFFTQTVTSPMSTPSEENVDFSKGFRRESSTNSSPKDGSRSEESPAPANQVLPDEAVEIIAGEVEVSKEEAVEESPPAEKYVDQVQENIYENSETMDESIYENVEDLKSMRSATGCFDKLEEPSENTSEAVSEEVIVSQIEQRKTSEFGEDDDVTEISDVYSLDKQVSDSDSSNMVLDSSKPEDNGGQKNDRFGVIQDYINNAKVADCYYQEESEDIDSIRKAETAVDEHQKVGYDDAEVIEYIALTEEPTRKVQTEIGVPKAEVKPDESGDCHQKGVEEEEEDETDDPFQEVRSPAQTRIVDEIVKNYVSTKSDQSVKNREKDTETVPAKIVQNLTSQFMKGGDEKEDGLGKKKHDANQLKSVDIMKQINRFEQKEEIVEKSSFSKFDALQKKNVLHIRSSDSTKAQEKFNGTGIDTTLCKCCGKQVFQMEQIKAEKAVWHKNCFRCQECNKQLNVDTYESNEGSLYCKPHFKALFAPKAVDDSDEPPSDKPDLGLEELQSLNVKERFQVFEQHQSSDNTIERTQVNVKRSPSISSKLAKFQSKGMDIGVTDESSNGIPIEETSSEEEEEEEEIPEGEDAESVRAKRVQKEKPFHFTGMSDVKNKFEHGDSNGRDERREERKQEIQSIRNKLFMGKQGKMKEAYQEAVMKSESSVNLKKEDIQVCDTKTIKERFEKGEMIQEVKEGKDEDEQEVYESEISKKSRSLFLQSDANASKAPQSTTAAPKLDVRKAREGSTPERELYHDPDIVRADEVVEDSVIAKETHTATKMLNKFRQMEENMSKEPAPQGPKPSKRFTPPPEPAREDRSSEDEGSESEEEEEDESDQIASQKIEDEDSMEAKKAARAKQLKAKFEKWEAKEIKKEQTSSMNINEEEQSQIESTKLLRERFESMRETHTEVNKQPKIKVNRFVELSNIMEYCEGCEKRVYPSEKISVHGRLYHKSCFKCKECNSILRMDSYTYNQGRLYCTPHFKRLFITKGNYDSAFGFEGHKEKWNSAVA